MSKREKDRRKYKDSLPRPIRLGLIICVFLILLLAIMLFNGLEVLLRYTGLLQGLEAEGTWIVIICAIASIAVGSLLSWAVLYIPMSPVRKLVAGMRRLADGHFEERIDLGDFPSMQELSESFNMLAGELQHTEMLRSDFVNNLSHEFKTPIVSIRGFAKMLQRPDLDEKQRQEYIGVIVDESSRLATMATNVLNLTKIENQHILSTKEEFNLSEQLRRCLVLLEKKWADKQLELNAEFDEYTVVGDETLLQQVWVNLLDNAVKFSPVGAELAVRIRQEKGWVGVSIHNHGPRMSDEELRRMYDKFWQGDTSHASEGAGIGLSIVKRIVDLHHGMIDVTSTDTETVFTVTLPKNA